MILASADATYYLLQGSLFFLIRNGFAKELKDKYDDFFMFEFFGEIFKWLPLAHVISGRILVVHGGLSSNLDLKLQDIAAIK